MNKEIADIRIEYAKKSLNENEVDKNPIKQFTTWWQEAVDSKFIEVNAMTLSTVDENNAPYARTVLLKGFDDRGFIFYTNYNSRKGNHISHNAQVCLLFFWKELERQVAITGVAEKTTVEESLAYFNSRPEGSRIGAWASAQSVVVAGTAFLKETFNFYRERFKHGEIPKPPHWGGYRVKPSQIEFWQGRPSRMHDRILYTLQDDGSWKIERLSP
ncbi:MAG TPA: pyridoxamine 5'-phosphate oxidase [Niabella sp.]|jgi:pyridoxamine 5'-phosphate oxidase|nr:pyridoxamine 5'-phosphate oxidase [Chitinophagaceae bacterium]HRN46634.1 pyridoxamine 5'-phosphate oxidase [Niabella sp.]HRO84896.1 pyridoxamine 5'-phosphate oxidase [Niabella sp.]HUN01277.1 pyridoxamine 5'-phosphate oxidase [Niabella sp.]